MNARCFVGTVPNPYKSAELFLPTRLGRETSCFPMGAGSYLPRYCLISAVRINLYDSWLDRRNGCPLGSSTKFRSFAELIPTGEV